MIRELRVLCIGNGGLTQRGGQLWSHRCIGGFVAELGQLIDEVCFCAWLDPSDDPLATTNLHGIHGGRALALPPIRGGFAKRLWSGIRSLAILVREMSQAHFVYLYWPGRLSSVTARLCRVLGKPYGIYFRGEHTDADSSFGTSFRNACFILTTGDVLGDTARAYCADVENVTPMTSVRPEHVCAPRAPRASGPWHLLYVGRIEDRKGVPDLLDAMTYLAGWDLPFTLTMVGHGPDAAKLMSRLPPSVAGHVRLVDAVGDFDNLLPVYRAADAFVFPSRCGEGFPRVLYEAMALGLPIVTTFGASVPAVMRDGVNCLRIEPNSPEDIAVKIRHLFVTAGLPARLASAANHQVAEIMQTWQRSHAAQIAERLGHLGLGDSNRKGRSRPEPRDQSCDLVAQ